MSKEHLAAGLAPARHDETARQEFVSALRKYVMTDLAERMRRSYEDSALPEFRREQGRDPCDGREVRRLMRYRPAFRTWSSLRYNAQEMTWASVQDQVERHLPALRDAARAAARRGPGSLRLDPSLEPPRELTSMDIHLMPGCFHSEYSADDVAQGAVYELGTAVFGGGLKFSRRGSVGWSVAKFIEARYPEFRPRRILDLGCTVGSNTLPYAQVFPGAEVHGIDVAAPMLRFALARAQHAGLAVHFSQQNAERTDFGDGQFDLVVSSFFLHELAVESTRRVLREAHRLLAPGGLMLHMELPPASAVDAYYNFFLNWDAYYNNEPHYASFRDQDLAQLVTDAGFTPGNYLQFRIANYTDADEQTFRRVALGEQDAPRHGNGASWFIFGARR